GKGRGLFRTGRVASTPPARKRKLREAAPAGTPPLPRADRRRMPPNKHEKAQKETTDRQIANFHPETAAPTLGAASPAACGSGLGASPDAGAAPPLGRPVPDDRGRGAIPQR